MSVTAAGVLTPQPTPTHATVPTTSDEHLDRALPPGHTRSLARSAVPGVIVGLLLGGGGTQNVAAEYRGGIAALGILSTTAMVTAINYTNHNGTFHDGKQWNHPVESMGIGAGIGAVTGAMAVSMVGKPQAMLAGALTGAVAGGINGAIFHFFNRPKH